MSEEWRAIPGYPDYEASSEGHIRSWKSSGKAGIRRNTPRILKGSVNNGGYIMYALLHEDGSRAPIGGHRLVALAFHGPCPEGMWTLHVNGDASDNRPLNVRYGTAADNSADACLHKAHPDGVLEGVYWDKETHALAQRLAEEEHRDTSGLIMVLIRREAARRKAAHKMRLRLEETWRIFQQAANNLDALLRAEQWGTFHNIPEIEESPDSPAPARDQAGTGE